MSTSALERAVGVAGSQSKLALAIGASQQIVSYWLAKAKPLPAEYVLRTEAATGISRHDLRPDIYPRATPTQETASRRASQQEAA